MWDYEKVSCNKEHTMREHTLKTLNTCFVDCAFHLQTVPAKRGSFSEREQITKEIDNRGSHTRNSKRKSILVAMTTLSSPLYSSLGNVRFVCVSFTYMYLCTL